jgi:hypothetical protein
MRSKGWLLPDTNDFIQLIMMYPYSSWGTIFPDLDHGKSSIPDKDPVSYATNWVLHEKLGTKHRSWQTHSVQYTLGIAFLYFVLLSVLNSIFGTQQSIAWAFLRISSMGFLSGVISHLFLDALSTEGIYLTRKIKIHFVPKAKIFHSGGGWENIVFKTLILIIFIMIIQIFINEVWGINVIELSKIIIQETNRQIIKFKQ